MICKEVLLRCCCGYMAAVKVFEAKFPTQLTQAELPQIHKACLGCARFKQQTLEVSFEARRR